MSAAAFPLQLVDMVSTEVFDSPLFAALCSTNMMQAAQRLARYKQLIAPMELDIAVDKEGILTVSPCWLSSPVDVPKSLQVAEDSLRPFLTVNEGMWQVFEPEVCRQLSKLDNTASTSKRTRAVLLELLPGGGQHRQNS